MVKSESIRDDASPLDPHSQSAFEPKLAVRWISLDCLRGVVIVLALYQHFCHFLTFWYRSYVKPFHFTDVAYQSHAQAYREGWLLFVDGTSRWLLEYLTPWSTHLFIVLAGLNIGLKSQAETRARLRSRLLLFAALLYFFTLENFVVAMSFGDALSIYPLQMWMILLALLNVVYARAGYKGVLFVFMGSFARFLVPLDMAADSMQSALTHLVHRDWEYNARFEYYVGSAAFGVLLGDRLRRGVSIRIHSGVFALSCVAVLGILLTWRPPAFNELDFFLHEYALLKDVTGTLGIFVVCLFWISGVVLVERLINFPRLTVFYWAGVSSLFIFALHRICFVHVTLPFYEWLSAQLSFSMRNSFFIVTIHVVAALSLIALFQKLKVLEVLANAGNHHAKRH